VDKSDNIEQREKERKRRRGRGRERKEKRRIDQRQEMREKLNNKRGIEGNNEEEQWKRKREEYEKKEWKKEDKIVFARKFKIWSNQYKETKRELEERKKLHKNKK